MDIHIVIGAGHGSEKRLGTVSQQLALQSSLILIITASKPRCMVTWNLYRMSVSEPPGRIMYELLQDQRLRWAGNKRNAILVRYIPRNRFFSVPKHHRTHV